MKTIEIKSTTGTVLFTHTCENNTIAKTVTEAVKLSDDLRYTDLRYTDLRSADLRYANLRYAKCSENITVANWFFMDGLYKYRCGSIISEDNKHYIKLGCYTRLVSEWEEGFWNNTDEFPNDNSIKSNLRVLAFETCKKWIEINSVKS